MNKLYSIGELLIDFESVGVKGLKDTEQFVKKAGGAPANVCAQAVKLGCEAIYLTKVGDDGFGEFLIETIKNIGVDTRFIKKDKENKTSLAFVSFQENGEREFSFYRKNAADLSFTPNDFLEVEFNKGDILEFGSVALASKEARETHDYLINKASNSGSIIAFDPNLRFNLWSDLEELRQIVLDYASKAHVIKIGKDELEFVANGEEDLIEKWFKNNLKLLLLTDGSKGAKLYVNGNSYNCHGYKVKTVDTTGAGDSCFGALLAELLINNINLETITKKENDYQHMLEFACKAGAYTTMNYGAIQAMGDKEHIERTVK